MMSIENFEDVHILLTKSLMFYKFQGAVGKIENKVEDFKSLRLFILMSKKFRAFFS